VIAVGGIDGATAGTPSMFAVILFTAVTMLVIAAVARRLRFIRPSARAQRVSSLMASAPAFADAELALALVAGCYTILAATGGLDSPLYPLAYAVVAFSVTFQSRAAAWTTVLATLSMEILAWVRLPADVDATMVVAFHVVFFVAAAVAHRVFLRGLVVRHRRDHELRVADHIRRQRESVRDYRLISSALGAESRAPRSRPEEELILASGSVATISASIFYALSLLKRSLNARTAIVLWLDEQRGVLTIKELVTAAEDVVEASEVGISGVIGAVVRDRALLSMRSTKAGQISYYESGEAHGAFLGVPVLEGPHLRGILCLDREQPFDESDAALATRGAEQVLHSIQSEQVFSAVERAKYEHERFYRASARLVQALTLEQVMETAFDAIAEIVEYDVSAITLYNASRKRHRICSVRMQDSAAPMVKPEGLTGLEFRDNQGLAAMVVKNKHYLPAAGELRDTTTPIFTKKIRFKNAESLVVLPLISADDAIGTLTLVSREKGRFHKDIREMLSVIANQVAISLENALMYKRMETMATTDGLTGLTNHRTFQERFGDMLERAGRHGHRAAILLCDVDHFKGVNDTYGHPVGDEVLRRVARVLQEAVRKIDITARYGGEEFVVVLEATDLQGALGLAERIRQDVGDLIIESDKGPFQVKMSIGVAAFPEDAGDKAMLIERADHALYYAKDSGRNRVISYQQFEAARRSRKAS
jgi:diguanylate cyclase (GGDEF)-like protein